MSHPPQPARSSSRGGNIPGLANTVNGFRVDHHCRTIVPADLFPGTLDELVFLFEQFLDLFHPGLILLQDASIDAPGVDLHEFCQQVVSQRLLKIKFVLKQFHVIVQEFLFVSGHRDVPSFLFFSVTRRSKRSESFPQGLEPAFLLPESSGGDAALRLNCISSTAQVSSAKGWNGALVQFAGSEPIASRTRTFHGSVRLDCGLSTRTASCAFVLQCGLQLRYHLSAGRSLQIAIKGIPCPAEFATYAGDCQ